MSKFPKGFLIGAATAAHQVEGNNTNCDCWAMEQMPHSSYREKSGIACDHYNRYAEDIRLMKQAGLNAYRFSIEWARIQPKEGEFDDSQIEHYREADSIVEDFEKYVSYVIDKLGSELNYVCTINEANLGLQVGAISRRYLLMAKKAAEAAKSGKAECGSVKTT